MTRRLVLNVGLGGSYLLWADERTWLGLLLGIAVGFIVIVVYDLTTGRPNYAVCLIRMVRFGAYFLSILIRANLQIAREIVTPGFSQTPRILRYPVAHLTPVQTTVFSNCITLTPGTLVVDVTADGGLLYVHCMYAADRESAITGLRRLDERLQREVFS
ncbi:MAG: Na+/H+ antiporter subunit E [Actinomycetota bacterium]|nr:Na+/H+ antiporter subunit E [Actinomycetota bacterium]